MKTKLYLTIAFRILLLMIVGIAWTFITPTLHDFFGDQGHLIITHHEQNPNWGPRFEPYNSSEIDYDWGVRHYWYFWCMLLLFMLTFINSVWSCINAYNKHYPSKS